MSKLEFISSVILLCLSVTSFFIGYMQYKEKGFLYNNAYIYASKKERQEMNKKPHYKQSAVVFTIIGIMFLTMVAELILRSQAMLLFVIIQVAILVVYTIASSIIISKKESEL